MTHKELIQDADSRMAKTVGVVKQELTTLKAGRANPQILDRILELRPNGFGLSIWG